MTSLASRSRTTHWWTEGAPTPAAVLPVAFALIAAQLAFRAWATFSSYWEGDDYLFIVQVFGPGGRSVDSLVTGIAGHVMPGGLLLTWWVNHVSPYDWTLAASLLVGLQLLASLGCLRMLVVGFGRRWGIVPPLVLYLATAFSVQSALWWATGVQALPVQVAFFWAMSSQLQYLRTRRTSSALIAVAWVVAGLCFYEKSILVIGALGIVTVAWFTTGTARERALQVWRNYRVSLVANLVLGVAYLAFYVKVGLSFDPGQAATYPIGPTADVMVLRTWATTVVGGPFQWEHTAGSPISFATPSSPVVVLAVVVLGLVLREIARSRTTGLRAVLLPGFFLVCDVLLVVAGRATLIGPVIGRELRYLNELSAVTAAALAFATMSVRGAVEVNAVRRPSVLLDRPKGAVAACLVLGVLGTYSTAQYVRNWQHDDPARPFFTHLFADARTVPAGTPVVDAKVPDTFLWPLAFPNNTLSRLLRAMPHKPTFAAIGGDDFLGLAPDGHLRQLGVFPVQQAVPRPGARCAYRGGSGTTTIPLQAPLPPGEWWVRIGYVASADSAVTVSAGGRTQQGSVAQGLHTLWFATGTDEEVSDVEIGGLVGGAHLCTSDVSVGGLVAPPDPAGGAG
jgi:hypothetical protein